MNDKIQILDDAIDDELNQKLISFFEIVTWSFGRKPHDRAPYPFWGVNFMSAPEYLDLGISRPLPPQAEVLSLVWNKIHPKLNGEYKVLSICSNGQTYGQDGSWHTDDNREGTYTLLVFVSSEWKIEWGGETRVMPYGNPLNNKGNNEVDIVSVLPIPKRVVYFPSNITHMGCAPNREFRDLRITLAYKLMKI